MNDRPTGPRIAVIATDWTGHRLTYIAALMRVASERGLDLKIVVDERAPDSEQWATFLPGLPVGHEGHTGHVVVTEDWSGATFPILNRHAGDVDHMIVLEADHLLDEVLVLLVTHRHLSVTNQLMREPRSPRAPELSPKERAVAIAKPLLLSVLGWGLRKRCRNMLLVSPLFEPGPIATTLIDRGAVLRLLDPVLIEGLDRPVHGESGAPGSGRDGARRTLADGAAVIGKLDERKSTDVLARAWSDPRLHHIPLRLCGATDADSGIAGLVEQAENAGATIEFADRFVSDDEIDAAIWRSTAVICAYTGDIPSGVAALAFVAGCPVIAFADTRLGRAIERHKLGVAVNDLNPATLLDALEKTADLDRSKISETAAELHAGANPGVFAGALLPETVTSAR